MGILFVKCPCVMLKALIGFVKFYLDRCAANHSGGLNQLLVPTQPRTGLFRALGFHCGSFWCHDQRKKQ